MAIGVTHMRPIPHTTGTGKCAGRGVLWDELASSIDRAYSHETLWQRTQEAVPYCRGCPIKAECFDLASGDRYTGVAGGHVFKEGLPVAPLRDLSQGPARMSA